MRRYLVPTEIGATLLPGQIYRGGIIRNITLDRDRVEVEVEMVAVLSPVDDHRQPRRPWRP
jgi:hypothetical protein